MEMYQVVVPTPLQSQPPITAPSHTTRTRDQLRRLRAPSVVSVNGHLQTMTTTKGSVLIPAHNEAAVIVRCLDALFEAVEPGELEVVVVCNGCSDNTAELARSSGHEVLVLELAAASKPNALRMGEKALTTFPRLYLDADIVLSGQSALKLFAQLRDGPALAVRPPISYESDRASLPVRRYYQARARLPAVMSSLWGAGVYGLSEAGRSRFGEYPEIVAEDLYVDQLFSEHEIEIVSCAPAVVKAPRRTADLVRIMRRSYRGKVELCNGSHGPGGKIATRDTAREVFALAREGPRQAADAFVYSAVAVTGRLMTHVGRTDRWERDESSRGI
jgi:Glycosyl transferase family 2